MKNTNLLTFAIVLFGALFLTSCKKETPAPASSTGTPPNNVFAGNWYDSETSSVNGPSTYPVVIEAPTTSTILFDYLYGFHTKISANVIGTTFTIPSQIIEGMTVSGSGTLSNSNQINMSYVVDNGLSKDNVTAILSK